MRTADLKKNLRCPALVITAAEVATAIKGIKSGKASNEDEIRPEVLKALSGEEILWLMRVCQVAWKFGKLLEIGKQVRIFGHSRKEKASNVLATEGNYSLVCQGKYIPNALKGNAEK